MTSSLTRPLVLGVRSAPSRVLFGAHETNLGRSRALGDRHVAYYARRAAGGAGIVVTETASVHPSDWPYERAPLAAECGAGWARIAQACRPHGALVLAGLGHTGAQGSSAFGQEALWAPSRVPDTASRELPMEMEQAEIDALVEGFAAAALLAVESGCDGVEVDAGPGALLRQFHSGLTNTRADAYGSDKLALTLEVLRRVRAAIGPDHLLGLRLSCDELAPWAGVTPEHAAAQAVAFAEFVDLLVVTRGGPYSASAYRPDGHTPPMTNLELARTIRTALAGAPGGRTRVVLQGSVVDPEVAAAAIDSGACDLVEMTRALIADAELPVKVASGTPQRVRPCVLCNQTCRVRDNRNPVVTCIADPRSGHETTDPDPETAVRTGPVRDVLVVGAGPAGLEAARVLARRGHRVEVVERSGSTGGTATLAAGLPGRDRFTALADWWRTEGTELGVRFRFGTDVDAAALADARRAGTAVLLATGSLPGPHDYEVEPGADVRTDAEVLAGLPAGAAGAASAGVDQLPDGPVVVLDLVGGPIGVGLAETLAATGRPVAIVTADQIVGTMLALSGDLADGNTRLLQAGVVRHTSRLLRAVRPGPAGAPGTAVLEDRFSGERTEIACAVLVHCGHRIPEESLYLARPGTVRAGDCVAPRSVLEAVMEGRRAADAIELAGPSGPVRLPVAVPAAARVDAGGTSTLAGAR